MELTRPSPNSIFDIYNPYGIKLLSRLRLGLSHLNEQKFNHGFNDTINPIWICVCDIESINHFFLHCPEYCEVRQIPFDNIQSTDKMVWRQNEYSLTHLFLYGDPKHNSNVNAFILNLPFYSVLLPLICTFILGIYYYLHLVLLAVTFVVIIKNK